MKIQLQQLTGHLATKPAKIYLVSGNEFLLVQEARDTIRKHAVDTGHDERETFHVESNFNWESFVSSTENLSIFGGRSLIELHLKGKLTKESSKILQNYAKNPAPDKIVLIITDKLDAAQQKSAWFKAIDAHGITIQIWPINASQLPLWISKRLQQCGLKADDQGIKLLADHASGNLLSLAQEIEKLSLLFPKGNLSTQQIVDVITDNSRFNVFELIDSTLLGNTTAVIRILENLKGEGVEPTIILWAIARELRTLINIKFALEKGTNIEQAMTQNGVWNNRRPLVNKALARHSLKTLQNMIKLASSIDLIIKGADKKHILWHELNRIYVGLSKAQTD